MNKRRIFMRLCTSQARSVLQLLKLKAVCMCVGFWKRSKFRPDMMTHPLIPLDHAVLAACFA